RGVSVKLASATTSRPHGLAWSDDGVTLAYVEGQRIKFYDAATNKPLARDITKAHADRVDAIAWSPDGKHLASAGNDGHVYVWDAKSGKRLRAWDAPGGNVAITMDWWPDSRMLAYTVSQGIHVRQTLTGDLVGDLRANRSGATLLAMDPAGKSLAVEHEDG